MADRLVGYIRVSSKAGRDDDRFLSPALQRAEMERWARGRYDDPRWVSWHEEIDRTGMTQSRPVLIEALAEAERTGSTLVVFALSRWARNVEGGLRDIDRMRDAGVRIESASEPVELESAIGRFGVQMLLAMAELEVGQKAEGWINTIRTNKEAGLWHGPAPLGYRRPTAAEAVSIGRASGVIVPDEVAGPLVRSLFERAAKGDPIEAMALALVDDGVFDSPRSLYRVLRNRAYLGEVRIPSGARRRKRNLDGTPRVDAHGRPKYAYDSYVWIDGRHEALVDRSTFGAVERRLASNPRSRPRASREMWWGSGRLRCVGCESVLSRARRKSGVTYLACQSKRRTGCTGITTPRLEVVEPLVVDGLRLALSGLVLPDAVADQSDVENARADIEAAELRLGEGMAEAVRLGLTERERDSMFARLRGDVDDAHDRLAALDQSTSLTAEALEAVGRDATELAARWTDLPDPKRRAALAALDVTFLVAKGPLVTVKAPWAAAAPHDAA